MFLNLKCVLDEQINPNEIVQTHHLYIIYWSYQRVWHSLDDRISASHLIKGTSCKLIIDWLFSEKEFMFLQSWKGSVALFILMQQKKLPWVEVYNSLFDSCLDLVLSSGFCTVTCSIWFIIWSHLTNEGKWRVGK